MKKIELDDGQAMALLTFIWIFSTLIVTIPLWALIIIYIDAPQREQLHAFLVGMGMLTVLIPLGILLGRWLTKIANKFFHHKHGL